MIAQYLDDIPQIFNRVFGRSGASANTPRGYEFFYNKEGATRFGPLGRMAQREAAVGKKGFGILSRPLRGVSGGAEHFKQNFGKLGLFGIVGAGALESYTARRGHKATGFTKGIMRGVAFSIGDVVGTALSGGNMFVGFAVGSAFEKAGAGAGDILEKFSDLNRAIKHVNMGGNYEDSRVAYTMRQRASQEMGSSVMNARSWLGREAVLLHQ